MAKLMFALWDERDNNFGSSQIKEIKEVEGTILTGLIISGGFPSRDMNIPQISLSRTLSTNWATLEMSYEELCKLIDDLKSIRQHSDERRQMLKESQDKGK